MDPNGIFARSFDEHLIRELPHLRFSPHRGPVSSRNLRIPLTLEPNANGIRDSNTVSKAGGSAGILPPRSEPGSAVTEGSNTTRLRNDFTPESLIEPPPRPILPAFVNLRALERFPYSSFDDDGHQSRKRRRLDAQPEAFGEHLQLPIPQAQKEQKPRPFGPLAILNGLNEPPPNAALLPPIEAGSITQLLTKPSRDSIEVEPALLTTSFASEAQSAERREGRIADILDSPISEKPSPYETLPDNGRAGGPDPEQNLAGLKENPKPAEGTTVPLSPKTRGRSRRNIRKWTDEETVALLRGVIRSGIGNWKEILARQGSDFNQRSASNLKDRFRVCCPFAYRASEPGEAIQHIRDALAKILQQVECDSSAKRTNEHQPFQAERAPLSSAGPPGLTHSGSSSSFSSLETNRDSPEDYSQNDPVPENTQTLPSKPDSTLDSLGISEPYAPVKSRRRSRRPFTAAEDEALLKGYAVHGFQWTLIQQDKELSLGHRKATDLRDRFRTKFPHVYRDGGSVRGSKLQAQMAKDTILKDGTNHALKSKQNHQASKSASLDSRLTKADGLTSKATGAVDPIPPSLLPPPVARDSSTSVPSTGSPFPLDECPTNVASVDLPPLIWDDIP
ncbi:hypothetical protein BDW62DRAFT_173313 [Aspergillus aurantiobrunneus]